jgi:hypothetical protein
VIASVPGIESIAMACHAWLDHPVPHPELVELANTALEGDDRLRRHLTSGCRAGLDPKLAREIEPWLTQWEVEAAVMLQALDLLEQASAPSIGSVWALGTAWRTAQGGPANVFGIRFAMYPVTTRADGEFVAAPGSIVTGQNLMDHLVVAVLTELGCPPLGLEPQP